MSKSHVKLCVCVAMSRKLRQLLHSSKPIAAPHQTTPSLAKDKVVVKKGSAFLVTTVLPSLETLPRARAIPTNPEGDQQASKVSPTMTDSSQRRSHLCGRRSPVQPAALGRLVAHVIHMENPSQTREVISARPAGLDTSDMNPRFLDSLASATGHPTGSNHPTLFFRWVAGQDVRTRNGIADWSTVWAGTSLITATQAPVMRIQQLLRCIQKDKCHHLNSSTHICDRARSSLGGA